MIKNLSKFVLTLIIFIIMLLILAYRLILNGKRNEDVYSEYINDFFKFWEINLEVTERKL